MLLIYCGFDIRPSPSVSLVLDSIYCLFLLYMRTWGMISIEISQNVWTGTWWSKLFAVNLKETRYYHFNLAFLNIKYFTCYRLGLFYMALPKGKILQRTNDCNDLSCFTWDIWNAKSFYLVIRNFQMLCINVTSCNYSNMNSISNQSNIQW